MQVKKLQLLFLVLSISTVAVLGVLRLSETYTGDQALFTVYASQILDGAVLYRDVWDVKQPGIFLFYLVGGFLFGFNEIGIHLFELINWLLFSILLSVLLNDYFRASWLVSFAPLFTVGYYYVVAGSQQLTQVEGLVGLPLFLSFALLIRFRETTNTRWWHLVCAVSGLSIASVIFLKLAYLPIAGISILLCFFWIRTVQKKKEVRGRSYAGLTISAIAIITPIVAIVIYFYFNSALDEFVYATFKYPSEAISLHGGWDRLPTLKSSVRWFGIAFLPLILLTVLFFLLALSRSIQRFRRGDWPADVERSEWIISLCLMSWLFVGLGLVLLQATSWWAYHFILFFIPLGILALKGADELLEFLSSFLTAGSLRPLSFLFGLSLITGFLGIFYTERLKNRETSVSLVSPSQIFERRGDNIRNYARILEDPYLSVLSSGEPDQLFVCGDPLYYYLFDVPVSISSNGWMPEFFVAKQWLIFESELERSTPRFLVIDPGCESMIRINAPGAFELINARYSILGRSEHAVWFKRNS